MWYSGHSHTAVANGKPQGKIGYASSPNGIVWAKYDKNPVLSPTSISPQWTSGYYTPSVYFDGALFHMWFTGWDELTWCHSNRLCKFTKNRKYRCRTTIY